LVCRVLNLLLQILIISLTLRPSLLSSCRNSFQKSWAFSVLPNP